jgi:hypothetical protein
VIFACVDDSVSTLTLRGFKKSVAELCMVDRPS